ncbi:MAG: hypothetical protein EXR27_00660 [Betaproteobacteria bacterium]|nr:hypothetical protein [Betaproteobacteria bacterium]
MKLHLSATANQNTFTGYGDDHVMINARRYEKSLIVLPDRLLDDWAATDFDALAAEHWLPLLELSPEVVLLGTGNLLRFPRPVVLRPLIDAGIGVEVMDVRAACRTYNILMSENRKVAAGLLLG